MHRRKQRTWRSGWRIGAANPEPSHIRYYESLFSLASGTTGIRGLREEAVVLRKFRPDLAATVMTGAAVRPSVEHSRKGITE
ncbi:MAG TPA: hypothetical protein VMY35_14915 [Phycisphaerae bacterium]|nr:hypothetical protein [Phycisphaerae bacterium]